MRTKRKIIGVTGAAGFIGSHLCEKLLSNNYKVIAIDNLSKGSKNNIEKLLKNKNLSFFKADIGDLKTVKKLFSNVDVVVHLAASKIPRYAGRLETLLVNTEGTKNILEAIKNKKSKLIFASTSDVYGKNPNLPFSEDSDLVIGSSEVARWAYAVSKIFDEHLCFSYFEKYKIPFVILRLFGIYGPKQHRSWWGGPQSTFIDALISNQEIEIHGSGKQTRSFLYIRDLTEAFKKVIDSKKGIGEIFNIGSTDEITIIDFAKKIANILDKPLKTKKIKYQSFTGDKYEDIKRKVPDISRFKKTFYWHPITNLDQGLRRTIDWYIKNPK